MELVINNDAHYKPENPCRCGSGMVYEKCCQWRDDAHRANYEAEFQERLARLDVKDQDPFKVRRGMEAEQIAREAMQCKDHERALELAAQALDMDPECADAYVIMDLELSECSQDSAVWMEKASACARKLLGEKYFQEHEGDFYRFCCTHTYMQSRQVLAMAYWDLRRQTDAIEICWELLRLDPIDYMEIRYMLFDYLLVENRLPEIFRLLNKFPGTHYAQWEYNKALYYYKLHGPAHAETLEQIGKAVQMSPLILKQLLRKGRPPRAEFIDYEPGTKEEAIAYMCESAEAWDLTPNAIKWLGGLPKPKL
jgi:tetratricopeptide (TPR) repeat protein